MTNECVHCGDEAFCYVGGVGFCEDCFIELDEGEMMEYLPIDVEAEDSQTTLDGFSGDPPEDNR